jgi:hypothetical protein
MRDPRLSLQAIAKSSGLSSDAGGSAIGDRKDLVPRPAIDRCTNVRLFMNCPITLLALAGDVRLALIRHDPRCVDVERGASAFAVAQQAARDAEHTLR